MKNRLHCIPSSPKETELWVCDLNQKSKIHGVSLIELLIVLSMVAMVILAIVPHLRGGHQVWEVVGDRHADVLQNSRIGMDKMARDLRQALSIIDAGGDYIEFVDRDSNNIRFQHNAQYLEYGPPGSPAILAGPVNSLSFTYYEADGVTTTTSLGDIRSALIELTTFDSEGKVSPITLSSRVLMRKDAVNVSSITSAVIYGLKALKMEGNAMVTGNVGSSEEIELKNFAVVNGDAVVEDADNVTIGDDAVLTGAVVVSSVVFPASSSFSAGSTNVLVKNSDHTILPPGSYRDLKVKDNGILTLQAGDYYFRKIDILNSAIIDFPGNGNIRIFAEGSVKLPNDSRIAVDGSVVDIDSEAAREKAKEVYLETLDKCEMKDTSQWIGTIFASSAVSSKETKLESSAKLTGSIYTGHGIRLKNSAVVEFVAPNSDLLPPQFSQ